MKEDEIEMIKKQNRVSKYNELLIENQHLCEEIDKLKEMNYEVNNTRDMITMQENLNKLQKQNVILQVEMKNKNEEISKFKKILNEKNNDITYLKKELELQNEMNYKIKNDGEIDEAVEKKIAIMETEISNYKEILNQKEILIESLDKQLSGKLEHESRIEILNMDVKNLNELMKYLF